jgi:hypothetical protein
LRSARCAGNGASRRASKESSSFQNYLPAAVVVKNCLRDVMNVLSIPLSSLH